MRLATRASFVGLAVATHAGAAPKAPGIAPTVTPVAPSVSIASIAKCDAARTLSFAVEKAAKGGDGSAARPFGSFGEALTSAAARSACKVTVTAGPGEYVEDVPIRLPHVVLASRSSERPIVRGTIHHAGGGLLELRSIDVARASGVAIRQSGGRLSMIGVRVNQTAAVSTEIDTGIGLWMSGGAEAFARISTFEDNAHNAIRAEGAGTRLWLTLGTVKKSGVHPLALARVRADPNAQNADIGAILVTRGASAFLDAVTLEESAGAGVDVAHGATARLSRVSIRKTSGYGGRGLAVLKDATVEWFDSNVNEASMAGVVVSDSAASTHGGFITKAPVGLGIVRPKAHADCVLRDGTQFREVGVPLQAERYELPRPLEGSSRPACPTVPAVPPPAWATR